MQHATVAGPAAAAADDRPGKQAIEIQNSMVQARSQEACREEAVMILEVPDEVREAAGSVLCQLCGTSIQGVICAGPLTGQVHYGCALLEQDDLGSGWQKRHERRRAQKMHQERWEKIRPKRSKKYAKQKRPPPDTSKPASMPASAPGAVASSCVGEVLAHLWQLRLPMLPVCLAGSVGAVLESGRAAIAGIQQHCATHLAEQLERALPGQTEAQLPCGAFLHFLAEAGHKIYSCLFPDHASGRYAKMLRPATRAIQKGSRGAHLARIAAARRGVRLTRWSEVRQARREHTWENSCCFNAAFTQMLALGLRGALALEKAAIAVTSSFATNAPTLDRHSAPQPRHHNQARSLAHACAQQACSKQVQQRVLQVCLFVCVAGASHNCMPSCCALLLAYAAVRGVAAAGMAAHSPNVEECRRATAAGVAIGTGLALGAGWALLGVALAPVLPHECLWWPPRCLKRPASNTGGPALKRPAGAILRKAGQAAPQAVAKRPAQDDEATAKWRPLLQQIAEWQAAHDGAVPTRTSDDLEERALAKQLSYMPRHLRPGGISSQEAVYVKLVEEVLAYLAANDGRMPRETLGTTGYLLARRWRKFEEKLEAGMRVSTRLQELLEAVQSNRREDDLMWSHAERVRQRKPVLDLEKQLQRNYRSWCAAHDQELRPEFPALQTAAAPGQAFAGTSPFPGFTNLASTCYFNSVLQCLFHCYTVRAALAGQEGGDERLGTTQLAKLLRMFVHGISAPQFAPPAKVDLFAPHEFADFLVAVRPRLWVPDSEPDHLAACLSGCLFSCAWHWF